MSTGSCRTPIPIPGDEPLDFLNYLRKFNMLQEISRGSYEPLEKFGKSLNYKHLFKKSRGSSYMDKGKIGVEPLVFLWPKRTIKNIKGYKMERAVAQGNPTMRRPR